MPLVGAIFRCRGRYPESVRSRYRWSVRARLSGGRCDLAIRLVGAISLSGWSVRARYPVVGAISLSGLVGAISLSGWSVRSRYRLVGASRYPVSCSDVATLRRSRAIRWSDPPLVGAIALSVAVSLFPRSATVTDSRAIRSSGASRMIARAVIAQDRAHANSGSQSHRHRRLHRRGHQTRIAIEPTRTRDCTDEDPAIAPTRTAIAPTRISDRTDENQRLHRRESAIAPTERSTQISDRQDRRSHRRGSARSHRQGSAIAPTRISDRTDEDPTHCTDKDQRSHRHESVFQFCRRCASAYPGISRMRARSRAACCALG